MVRGNILDGSYTVFDCGENQVGMLFLLEGAFLLDLDICRADGTADGIDALDAGLKTCGQHNQSMAFFADPADTFGTRDLLQPQTVIDRRGPLCADTGDHMLHGKTHALLQLDTAAQMMLLGLDDQAIHPVFVHLSDLGDGSLEDFYVAAQQDLFSQIPGYIFVDFEVFGTVAPINRRMVACGAFGLGKS